MVIVSDKLGPNEFVAICEDCRPVMPLSFETEAKRDEWVTIHLETGHKVHSVNGKAK